MSLVKFNRASKTGVGFPLHAVTVSGIGDDLSLVHRIAPLGYLRFTIKFQDKKGNFQIIEDLIPRVIDVDIIADKKSLLVKNGSIFKRHYTLKLRQVDLQGIKNCIERKRWVAPPITKKMDHSICFSWCYLMISKLQLSHYETAVISCQKMDCLLL